MRRASVIILIASLLLTGVSAAQSKRNRETRRRGSTPKPPPPPYYATGHYNTVRATPELIPSNISESFIRLSDPKYERLSLGPGDNRRLVQQPAAAGARQGAGTDRTGTIYAAPAAEDVKIFIGVFTASTPPDTPPRSKYDYFARRQTLRATWGRRAQLYSHMVVRFIVGVNPDPVRHRAMMEEAAQYGDVLIMDTRDTYDGLTNKTRSMFGTALDAYPNLEWVVKMDDDAFLLPERLLMAVDQYAAIGADYAGCMWTGRTWPRDHRWYDPNSHLIGPEYTLRALGTIYVVSARVLGGFVHPRLRNMRLSGSTEDAAIGIWMLASNAVFYDDWRLCSVTCNNATVAVYDLNWQGLPVSFWPRVDANPDCHVRPPWPLPYHRAIPQHLGHMRILK